MFIFRATMHWTDETDVIVMREMAARGVFDYKSGSRERGNAWQEVATAVNTEHSEHFNVTMRGVRDRFTTNMKKYKAKVRNEIEMSEFDMIIEDLIERYDESERKSNEENNAKKSQADEDKQKAQEFEILQWKDLGKQKA